MLLKNVVIRCVEVASWLQTVPMLGGQSPVLITLGLILEFPMTSMTPNMLVPGGEMLLKLRLCTEAKETSQTDEVVASDRKVVLEVIFQAPCVDKGA